jgi:hypothetical protein
MRFFLFFYVFIFLRQNFWWLGSRIAILQAKKQEGKEIGDLLLLLDHGILLSKRLDLRVGQIPKSVNVAVDLLEPGGGGEDVKGEPTFRLVD